MLANSPSSPKSISESGTRSRSGTTGVRKRWAPKVRSGCVTCRTRRVKCDEKKPRCLRCCRLNEVCQYEDQSASIPFKGGQQSAFKQVSISDTPSLENSITPVYGTSEETRYLDTFRALAAPWFGKYAARYLWENLVPKYSWSHPALRHALVALAMASEQYLCSWMVTKPHRRIWHYNQALQHLHQDQSVDPDIVMLSCILFWMHDNVMNNARSAMVHLKGFLHIALEHKQAQARHTDISNLQTTILRGMVYWGHYQDSRLAEAPDPYIIAKIRKRIFDSDYSEYSDYSEAVVEESALFVASTAWICEEDDCREQNSDSLSYDELEKFIDMWYNEFANSSVSANNAKLLQCYHWLFKLVLEVQKKRNTTPYAHSPDTFLQLEEMLSWVESFDAQMLSQTIGKDESFVMPLVPAVTEFLRLAPTLETRERIIGVLRSLKRVETFWNSDVVASLMEAIPFRPPLPSDKMNPEAISYAAEVMANFVPNHHGNPSQKRGFVGPGCRFTNLVGAVQCFESYCEAINPSSLHSSDRGINNSDLSAVKSQKVRVTHSSGQDTIKHRKLYPKQSDESTKHDNLCYQDISA